jgi:hypothetical protein
MVRAYHSDMAEEGQKDAIDYSKNQVTRLS